MERVESRKTRTRKRVSQPRQSSQSVQSVDQGCKWASNVPSPAPAQWLVRAPLCQGAGADRPGNTAAAGMLGCGPYQKLTYFPPPGAHGIHGIHDIPRKKEKKTLIEMSTMAARSLCRRAISAPSRPIFGTIPRAACLYSTAASKPPTASQQPSASEPETHFGFQTVKESLKAGKGNSSHKSNLF